jgi:hypothetical protein
MGQTKTNNFGLSYAEETSPGVLGGSPVWKILEPNNIPSYGAETTTVAREPISKRRQRRKGKISDLSSAVEIEHDTTMDPLEDFMSAFVVANWQGTAPQLVTAADADSFTTGANGITFAADDLVHVRGMTNPTNNGLHVVNGVPTDTDVTVATVLTVEASPPANATIERAGIRGAAGDFEIDAAGDLISTLEDFTTLPLYAGQTIWIGGEVAANQFFEQASTDTNYGFARITLVEANKLTLDKRTSVFATDDGTDTGAAGTPRQIDLFFGRFLRNVSVDDADYAEKTYHFEGAYDNLENGPPGVGYEYAIGNYANELSLTLPETEKSTMTLGFVGIDTEEIVASASRKAGASTALEPVRTDSFGTSTDIARLRLQQVDETGLTTCFRSLSITLQNNVEPEKCLGTLGSPFINLGNFFVNMEATVLFTEKAVIKAIKDNETIGLDFVLDNSDGAIAIDLPATTLGGGGREFALNRSITVSLTGEAFGDPLYNASILVSNFPYVPAV